jgi:putative radical SAM enzyme (TIGR03279 family)
MMISYAHTRKGGKALVKITDVLGASRGEKAGILPNDILVSINGKEINDVLDYRFYLANKVLDIKVLRDGTSLDFKIKKLEYDDIGLDFETPLMDKKHSCENKCVFCFIDQLPRGMRKTLYFKDDDSRLSFLHGNYVTLTNMNERDIQRIIDMRISPVNVSVHTTNPELRVKMMHNKRAGEVLDYLRMLADGGISLCCQIVLCKGLNDKEELDRSLHDLIALRPALESVAIVPAGLTQFREKLYPLEHFTPKDSEEIISQINAYGDWCKKEFGTRIFYPSDEFYLTAGLPLPDDSFYEDYSQIENGVGMLTDMKTSFDYELEDFLSDYKERFISPRVVSVATGYAAHDHISGLCQKLEAAFDGLKVHVYPIKNNFFGERITVAGLLTGKDMGEQLSCHELGEELLIPSATLRAEGDVFLDDISPKELSDSLGGIKITPTSSDAHEFICNVLGIKD